MMKRRSRCHSFLSSFLLRFPLPRRARPRSLQALTKAVTQPQLLLLVAVAVYYLLLGAGCSARRTRAQNTCLHDCPLRLTLPDWKRNARRKKKSARSRSKEKRNYRRSATRSCERPKRGRRNRSWPSLSNPRRRPREEMFVFVLFALLAHYRYSLFVD